LIDRRAPAAQPLLSSICNCAAIQNLAMPPDATASGSSVQSAENNLDAQRDALA
jgi:hypothetical protein